MASNIDECADSIIQAMDDLFNAKSETLRYDKTYRGKVINITSDGKYTVSINGADYALPYDGNLSIGDVVRVKSPMNNFSEIYIEPVASERGGGGGTSDYTKLSNKPILDTTSTSGLQATSETILGIISLHKVSKTGSYNDLLDKPNLSNYLTQNNIIDNLTSSSSTDVLSAKQGKVLNTSISSNTSMIDTLQEDLLADEQDISDLKSTRLTKDNIIAGTNVSLEKDGNNITINADTQTAPVTSVNTKTGDVVLTSNDIGVYGTLNSLTTVLSKKLETSNLKEGDNISLTVSGNDITISSSGGISLDDLKEYLTGTVLYSSSVIEPSDSITLTGGQMSDYSRLEIIYRVITRGTSPRTLSQDMTTYIDLEEYSTRNSFFYQINGHGCPSGSGNVIYQATTYVDFYKGSNTIAVNTSYSNLMFVDSDGTTTIYPKNNYIYIKTIKGYKY